MNYIKTVMRQKKFLDPPKAEESPAPSVPKVDPEKEQLQKENSKLTREISRLKSDIESITSKTERQEEQIKRLQSTNADQKIKIEELEDKILSKEKKYRRTAAAANVGAPQIQEREVIKEVIKEVVVEKIVEKIVPRDVIKEVVKIEYRDSPVNNQLMKYENKTWWNSFDLMNDVIDINQKRLEIVHSIESIAARLRSYDSNYALANSSQLPISQPQSAVDLREYISKISKSHESWQSVLSESLKSFFSGSLNKPGDNETNLLPSSQSTAEQKMQAIIEDVHKIQGECLSNITEFYHKLDELDSADQSKEEDSFNFQKFQKLQKELKPILNSVKEQYGIEFNDSIASLSPSSSPSPIPSLGNTSEKFSTSFTHQQLISFLMINKSANLPHQLIEQLKLWTAWYSHYQETLGNQSAEYIDKINEFNQVNKNIYNLISRDSLVFNLLSATSITNLPNNQNNLGSSGSTSLLSGSGSYLQAQSQFQLPVINGKTFPSGLPEKFLLLLNLLNVWLDTQENYFKKNRSSDNELHRQQQAREESRRRVSTFESQINRFLQEEKEIEEKIAQLQKMKIQAMKSMREQARYESKILDLEIMLEEADFTETTADDIKQQLSTLSTKIENLRMNRSRDLEEKRQIHNLLRGYALRGHLSILINSEIFDAKGFCNELLRGGMESLYLAGESINDYEQIESFAKSVAKYRHKQDLNKICVMKKYEIMDEKQVKFFRNELKLLHKIQHPFIGAVNGVLFTKSEAYIQLPFYSGGSLRDKINQLHQRRTQADYQEQSDYHHYKKIFHEILQALAHLHSQSITHYDIKPENIVIDEFGHPVLIDFGISEGDNCTLFELNNSIRGSVGYMAPEIKAGQPSSLTSDCWSFGVMLFETFFDPKDYQLDTLGLFDIPKHADDDLRQLLKGLLNPDPTKRFTATQALRSNYFKNDSYDKMFQITKVITRKKLDAFRIFLEAIRNKDRLFILNIHRESLVKDIFTEFRNKCKESDQMKFQTVVQYIGEKGVDTGGLRRDLYCTFFQEICDEKYSMFQLSQDKRYYYPVPDSQREGQDAALLEEQYLLFGKILAKSLIDGDVIGDFFPITLFKFLADQPESIDLSDVFLYDKQLYGNLQSLLMQSINDWELDWDIEYNPSNFQSITDNNKDLYIQFKCREVLIEHRKVALNAIKTGFQFVAELQSHLALLSPVELRLLLSGETYIDGEMVLHQFQFEERWKEADAQATRENLCKWIRSEATPDQLKLVLMLTTASPTIPVGGFSPPITVRYVDGMYFLPFPLLYSPPPFHFKFYLSTFHFLLSK